MSLQNIKNLFISGMNYAKKKYKSFLFSRCDDLCDYQIALANKAEDINSLMNAIWIGNINYTWTTAFKAPKPICSGCELAYTGIQYGVGPVGWYFFYGTQGSLCFNLTFFRLELAPSKILEQNNVPKSQGVMWNVLGGFGTIGQNPEWYSVQSEWISMEHTTFNPEYSTFMLNGAGKSLNVSLKSDIPMSFVIQLSFTDVNSKAHTLNVSMMGMTPPNANVPNSCECGFGLGSFYYSYPKTTCNIQGDGTSSTQIGSGWVDHQLIKGGIANSLYGQALQSMSNIITKNVTGGWLWTTIQDDQSGIQYMLTHFFGKKFFQDDIQVGNNISNSMINVYKKGLPYFNPSASEIDVSDFKMVMTKTVNVPYTGMNMPASYNITLPGGKEVVLSISTAPNVYPTAFAPYETPALLYDAKSGSLIGQGIIEANFYFDNETLVKRMIDFAGGDSTDSDKVNILQNALLKKQTVFQKILSTIVFLIPLFILVLCLLFIFKSHDKKNRALLIVALLLLFYMIYNLSLM